MITPFPLQIELGQTSVSFRIAAPRTILLKPYYITWSKTGDSFIPAYAPLRRTELDMRSKYYIRTVLLEPMEYIPVDGRSYPLAVYTNNPPYEQLLVNMVIMNSDTLAILDSYSLNFPGGSFQVHSNYFFNLKANLHRDC